MSDIVFLAIPNIEGMRILRYLKVFGSVSLFGVCLFIFVYIWKHYRQQKKRIVQFTRFDEESHLLQKHLLLQKIATTWGKELLILFIDYLERFVTLDSYSSISDLLLSLWYTSKEIQKMEHVLYANQKLSEHLESKIHSIIARL